jgi:hypothetical protein
MKSISYVLGILFIVLSFVNCGHSKSGSGVWKILEVKDKFGDKVKGESVIAGDFSGKGSNGLTPETDILIRVQIRDSTIAIAFSENNGRRQAILPENQFMNVDIKLSNGKLISAKVFLSQNMMWDDSDTRALYQLLMSEKDPFKVNVDLGRASEYTKTIYNFEINPKGLKNLLQPAAKWEK